MIIEVDDNHPYCGPHTIMRFHCAQQHKHYDNCQCEHAHSSPGEYKCKRGTCSQYFYSTIHDLQRASSLPMGHACCWTAHISDDIPIYKCITALEIVTGMRFDFPILARDGLRVGYNPDLRLAIVYNRNDPGKDIRTIQRAFRTGGCPCILRIDPDVVIREWAGPLPSNRCRRDVAEHIALSIVALAFHIVSAMRAQSLRTTIPSGTFSVDHVASFRSESWARFEILTRRIQSGRLLVGDEIIAGADDRAPLAPRHDIKTSQFRTGTSGPPIPDNDPYQIENGCAGNLFASCKK